MILSYSYSGGGGGGLLCLLLKKGKKGPNFGKECSDCGHLWVKFLISSAIFKSFQWKKTEIFPAGTFFFVL